jgi:hypothetical protein
MKRLMAAVVAGLVWTGPLVMPGNAQAPTVQIPKPGVPEIMTMEGKFIRVAYNNEGYVILGYQAANRSAGGDWMLLEVGMTVMDKVPNYMLTRDAITLDTPDGKSIPLATITEFQSGNTQALQSRAKVQRDTISYFPTKASTACRLGFFADLEDRARPWDQVELSSMRGCLGRLYFQVPGGIKHGQHWLNVKFAQSLVRVPFRIMTEEEEKMLSKNYKAIDKQIEEAFSPKKK